MTMLSSASTRDGRNPEWVPETALDRTLARTPSRQPYGAAGQACAAALLAEVERRGIVKRWLAEAIGQSYNQLVRVLSGHAPSWVTLGLVEDVLGAIDAGQVSPVVHPVRVAPALGGSVRGASAPGGSAASRGTTEEG